MAEQRILTRAPIVEAVIDLRCTTGIGVNVDLVKALGAKIDYQGPQQHMNEATFTMQAGPGVAPSQRVENKLLGGRYTSKDGRFVVQLRSNGFTFSRLSPYSKWDDVFPEAWRVWEIFCEQMKVGEVTRIGVRNINRMVFPRVEFSENPGAFLTPPPSQPLGVDGIIAQWLTRFVVNDIMPGVSAIVTQMSDKEVTSPDRYAMILDIDVFTSRNLSLNSETLKPRFIELRKIKDDIFFASVTEKTLNLFS